MKAATMTDQDTKRGRGRPPKGDDAKTGAERQALYAKARQRDMAEVAYALKDILARTKANQKPAYQPSDPLRPIDLKAQFWRWPSIPHV
jgi:hypothetical protein